MSIPPPRPGQIWRTNNPFWPVIALVERPRHGLWDAVCVDGGAFGETGAFVDDELVSLVRLSVPLASDDEVIAR